MLPKLIKWSIGAALVSLSVLGGYAAPELVSAAEGEKVVESAHDYISHLDGLREMGQVEMEAVTAREMAAFEHTSQLDALRQQAAAAGVAGSAPVIADANAFISHLDGLRATATRFPADANAFISHLDGLRQKGFTAPDTSAGEVATR